MINETVLEQAEFNPAVTTYWLLNGVLVLLCTFFGIILIPVWWFGGKWITQKYLDSHKCTLTDRNLHVSKGILNQVEKTVPLDRITDLGIVQGPIMRYYDLETLSVETAGQSGVGSLIRLTGIKNGRAFKEAVLKQRDIVTMKSDSANLAPAALAVGGGLPSPGDTNELLREIRDSLNRIESKIEKA